MKTETKEKNKQEEFEKDEFNIQNELSAFLNKYDEFLHGLSILKSEDVWQVEPVINGEKYSGLFDEKIKKNISAPELVDAVNDIKVKAKEFISKHNNLILGFKVLKINNRWNIWVKAISL